MRAHRPALLSGCGTQQVAGTKVVCDSGRGRCRARVLSLEFTLETAREGSEFSGWGPVSWPHAAPQAGQGLAAPAPAPGAHLAGAAVQMAESAGRS